MTRSFGKMIRNRTTWVVLVAFSSGACLVSALPTTNDVQAQSRRVTEPGHFKSGAQRSEQLLQEILTTLKSIDRRMERIEPALQREGNIAR